ncbi:tRNA (guanine(37)-N(1))-methyltransferase [Maylandia zebra]|uniref:tRNA (guanine(37)-N1)-methyltransferase n=1 Tax=Astatotilapia calliptera TaxID=8154 RepID=A0A3P8QL13_ASTCA|nr:tRNA (guanine(37)-N1)-methyltransferase [Astatotilapia calliptera]
MLRFLGRIFVSAQTQRSLNPATVHRCFCSAAYPCLAVKPIMEPKLYRPPPEVRGMTSLDKDAFTQTITVPALRVPIGVLNKVVKSLKKSSIQRPGVPRVVQDKEQSSDFRLVLLDPRRVSSPSSFSETEAEALRSFSVSEELHYYELKLTYDNLKSEEVLEAVLPQGQDVTSAFSRVGHIAHMNLRDHQLTYKNLIGQVIMDKNPGVTCVVNKTNIIDSTYRNFKMEVLAGEENMVAKVKENGVTYEFDFSRVYWNPRLSTEHQRVVQLVKRGDTVFDIFAGVGPFAIPAARLGASILANDLNPESYRWLQHNCKLNKVESKVRAFNLDGRAFIRGPLKQELPVLMRGTSAIHVVMNLPALALDFLDAFRGLLHHQEPPCDENLPTVHCYGFSKDDDPDTDVVERASRSLGFPLKNRCSVHFVRNVAPNKDMMCVRFTLPKDILFGSDAEESEQIEEPASKRQKCEETTNAT